MHIFANYAIQCLDHKSGLVGDFIFDNEQWQETGEFHAVSPVFEHLSELFQWSQATGHHTITFHTPIHRSK